jgi:hypothetical protein
MSTVIGRLWAKARNKAIGGTPLGIMLVSCAPISSE